MQNVRSIMRTDDTYVTNVQGFSTGRYGTTDRGSDGRFDFGLYSAGKMRIRMGASLYVMVTFLSFALFPLAVVLCPNFASLILAFHHGGLREIGEPSRKQ